MTCLHDCMLLHVTFIIRGLPTPAKFLEKQMREKRHKEAKGTRHDYHSLFIPPL